MSQTASETTVRTYLSAVRFYQIRIGLPDPSQIPCPKLPYILKGIQNSTTTSTRFHRLPITPDHLRAVYNVWSTPPVLYDKVMLWAAICVGFFGFLRSGEFTATPTCNSNHVISAADISVDSHSNPQVVTITLCHSKTNQAGKGSIIYLGRTGDKVCPVTALLAYLAVRPPSKGPLFIFNDGTPLSQQQLITYLRNALFQAGFSTRGYSGHSLRIGAATTAARMGLSDSLIQTLGRWKSSAFTSYIRKEGIELSQASAHLAKYRCTSVPTRK